MALEPRPLVASWEFILMPVTPSPVVFQGKRQGHGIWENHLSGPLFCLHLVFARLGLRVVTEKWGGGLFCSLVHPRLQ